MRRVEERAMVDFMMQNGIAEEVATREVSLAASHPYVEAGVE